jgi:hypothetical protein
VRLREVVRPPPRPRPRPRARAAGAGEGVDATGPGETTASGGASSWVGPSAAASPAGSVGEGRATMPSTSCVDDEEGGAAMTKEGRPSLFEFSQF